MAPCTKDLAGIGISAQEILLNQGRKGRKDVGTFMIKHCVEKQLLFSEADPGGIAQFHMMFAWLLEAEQSFFRSLGIPLREYWGSGGKSRIGWVRQHASLDFFRPIVVDEKVTVCLEVRKMTQRTLTFEAVIESAVELKAKGTVRIVCIQHVGENFGSIPIPEFLRNKIQQHMNEACPIS
jgi:acyl-CoA thioesterase FadM